jgi:DNA primase
VVATAGTALTEPHLKALSRLTGDIRLSFDADKAGVAATERAIPVAAKVGVSLAIITIPSGKDPDELIKQDVSVWQDIIKQPQYAVDWLIDRYSVMLDLTSAQGKREFSDVVLKVVRQLPDTVEQDHYIGVLAARLDVSKEALNTKLATVPDETVPVRQRPIRQAPAPVATKEVLDKERTEEHLLALTLLQPRLRSNLYSITPEMFTGRQARQVLEFLKANPDYDGSDKAAVREFADYVKILSLVYETLYQDLDAVELSNETRRLSRKLIAQYVRTENQQLTVKLQSAEGQEADELLRKVVQLNELLRLTQGG